MNKSIAIKALALSFLFAFSLNAASAQKSVKKSDKAKTEQRINASKEENSQVDEPKYRWFYSVATIQDMDGKFDIEFEESKTASRNESMMRAQEMGKKMSGTSGMFTTESDILNFLAEQNFEIVSILPFPGKEGKVMKYYLRSKVELPN